MNTAVTNLFDRLFQRSEILGEDIGNNACRAVHMQKVFDDKVGILTALLLLHRLDQKVQQRRIIVHVLCIGELKRTGCIFSMLRLNEEITVGYATINNKKSFIKANLWQDAHFEGERVLVRLGRMTHVITNQQHELQEQCEPFRRSDLFASRCHRRDLLQITTLYSIDADSSTLRLSLMREELIGPPRNRCRASKTLWGKH